LRHHTVATKTLESLSRRRLLKLGLSGDCLAFHCFGKKKQHTPFKGCIDRDLIESKQRSKDHTDRDLVESKQRVA
jgi:phage-related protein